MMIIDDYTNYYSPAPGTLKGEPITNSLISVGEFPTGGDPDTCNGPSFGANFYGHKREPNCLASVFLWTRMSARLLRPVRAVLSRLGRGTTPE